MWENNANGVVILYLFLHVYVYERSSSLAKGLAHGPLSLHPWQIELDFVIPGWREKGPWAKPLASEDDERYSVNFM